MNSELSSELRDQVVNVFQNEITFQFQEGKNQENQKEITIHIKPVKSCRILVENKSTPSNSPLPQISYNKVEIMEGKNYEYKLPIINNTHVEYLIYENIDINNIFSSYMYWEKIAEAEFDQLYQRSQFLNKNFIDQFKDYRNTMGKSFSSFDSLSDEFIIFYFQSKLLKCLETPCQKFID